MSHTKKPKLISIKPQSKKYSRLNAKVLNSQRKISTSWKKKLKIELHGFLCGKELLLPLLNTLIGNLQVQELISKKARYSLMI